MEFCHLLTALIQLPVVPSDNILNVLVENMNYLVDYSKASLIITFYL